jgi:prepilin-type N-terminal cleavage/methylation domain-containing protein
VKKTAKNGFSLIELLIVTVIGLFILEAAYLLYSGSAKLFKDVKTTSDNIQTKVPAMELVSRFFDRWGMGVYTSGTANCDTYPPSDMKCITVTTGTPCDEVSFWGSFHGTGFVTSVSGTTAAIVSCRLSKTSTNNCHYLWRNDVLQNTLSGSNVIHLALNNNLSVNNADCSELTSGSPVNATVESTLDPWSGAVTKTVQAGDVIHRAPHKLRLYCALNSTDSNQRWLYLDLADTASECNSAETASPIAPVDAFKVDLLPASCNATTGGCRAAKITLTLRSQAKNYAGSYKTETVEKIFGR